MYDDCHSLTQSLSYSHLLLQELRSFKRIKASINTAGTTPESMHNAILDVLLSNDDFPIIKMYKEKNNNPDKRNSIIESNEAGNMILMADLIEQIK